ncbi:MAG: hypothetical protein M3328_14980 [Chloroflexota bacterium]|nr:hypothetical protein [Chloroflexota bacterium]
MPVKSRNLFAALLAGAVAFALVIGVLASGLSIAQGQANCQKFSETGKSTCGKFLEYWKSHGGLPQQGYPISEQMQEKSDVDGKTYTVQYFERAVFELHPEKQPPYDVLLSLLGSLRYKEKYPNGAQELPDDAKAEAGMTFPETGKTVKGVFLEYWKNNGGLAQQGFPITNLIREKSEIDGKEYTMQYFERAVFELHPEQKPPYNVLLSQLGTMRYKMKYAATSGTALPIGEYGGEHLGVSVSASGIFIEFDCANASFQGPITVVNGQFTAQGTYTRESGVQMDPDMRPPGQPATLNGTLNGATMTITITIEGEKTGLVSGTQQIGPFTATKGKQPVIRKCM